MKKPECILIRIGESALKSKQVQRIWFGILVKNIKNSLDEKKIKYKLITSKNRIFIYTKTIKKTSNILKKIYGITSFSPCYTCFANLNDMKILACEIAKKMKLSNKTSFAVRPRRAGKHKFSSRTIAEEVGAAIKRTTDAKVDLSNPEHTFYIEVRSRRVYIFTERIAAAGGLPIGTGGKVLALIKNKEDIKAAKLITKRGCELILIYAAPDKSVQPFMLLIEKFYLGRRLRSYKIGDTEEIEDISKKEDAQALVIGEKTFRQLKDKLKSMALITLRPLIL